PVFPLSNIDRGSHTLSVEILDEQGRIIERTASQPFHMQRTSLAQKRKIKPCTLDDYGQRPECPLNDKPAEEKNPFLRLF
ncbi:MAG: penicillin-binding protein, partial [Pseudomonas laurylsulfatiphila]